MIERKQLSTNDDNENLNEVNAFANIVSAFIDIMSTKRGLGDKIIDKEYQLMLMTIDEAIADGFSDYIRDYKPAKEHSDFEEHNTLSHAQQGTKG